MSNDYKQGFRDGWKAAMEHIESMQLGVTRNGQATQWPPAPPMTVVEHADPCAGCRPDPNAEFWVCGNAACPKRMKIT